jgi:hypothetical protein
MIVDDESDSDSEPELEPLSELDIDVDRGATQCDNSKVSPPG